MRPNNIIKEGARKLVPNTQGCKYRLVTGNYRPFFCLTSHLPEYLLLNISYINCVSMLFKINFEISI